MKIDWFFKHNHVTGWKHNSYGEHQQHHAEKRRLIKNWEKHLKKNNE